MRTAIVAITASLALFGCDPDKEEITGKAELICKIDQFRFVDPMSYPRGVQPPKFVVDAEVVAANDTLMRSPKAAKVAGRLKLRREVTVRVAQSVECDVQSVAVTADTATATVRRKGLKLPPHPVFSAEGASVEELKLTNLDEIMQSGREMLGDPVEETVTLNFVRTPEGWRATYAR